MDQRLTEANCKQFSSDYNIGNQVLKLVYQPNKLQSRAKELYTINTVHTNGTVTICLNPHTIERISIRHIKPYRT